MERQHEQDQGDNADYPWDNFDSANYFRHNYSALRHDDRQILEAIRDFFSKADRSASAAREASDDRPAAAGLDLGSGTNLYPALAMLPFCAELTLWEFSARNTEWLRQEIKSYSASWDKFWERLALSPPYHDTADPRAVLAARTRVHQGSVFDLPTAAWDMGTMFFVAESLTSNPAEFTAATHRFVDALHPGAPFAAAFMENSTGYDVGDQRYPAVAVTQETVRHCLDEVSRNLDVQHIDAGNNPLRDGYSGMILVLGTAGVG
jgi:hypothetical protein